MESLRAVLGVGFNYFNFWEGWLLVLVNLVMYCVVLIMLEGVRNARRLVS